MGIGFTWIMVLRVFVFWLFGWIFWFCGFVLFCLFVFGFEGLCVGV